jgi:outer membrane protein OmpA-like peptidoglycan-associated protein
MSKFLASAVLLAAVGLAGCASDASRRAAVVRSTSCNDFAFSVYFQPHADGLTTAAAQSIAAAAARTQGCHVASLTVTGLSGEGDSSLAKRRADAVAKALEANGLANPAPTIETEDQTGGLRLLGRRTEVRVHFGAAG